MSVNSPERMITDERRESQGGYVAVLTALMLVPLMIMAAFAVDVGSWYSAGAKTQTASDAAALAGVAHLPDFDAVVVAALAEAQRNGYVDADGHSQATYDNPASYPQILVTLPSESEVQVLIKTQADAVFGKVVLPDGIEVTRLARSEFIKPVPMGNPTNQLGGGHLLNPMDKASAYWLNVQAYCAFRANGTRSFVGFENDGAGCWNSPNSGNPSNLRVATTSFPGGPWTPQGLTIGTTTQGRNWPSWPYPPWRGGSMFSPNAWYGGNDLDDDYFVAIEVPANAAFPTWSVQIFRPGTCISRLEGPWTANTNLMRPGSNPSTSYITGPRLTTRLYNVDTTLVDRWDAVVQGNWKDERTWPLNACSGDNGDGWYEIDTVSAVGTHYLSYGTEEVPTEVGNNVFALRVVPNGSTTIVTDAQAARYPTISAVEALPVFIDNRHENYNTVILQTGDSVDLYLAEIEATHAGKTLEIDLFDAGEGMSYLQILDPTGTPMDFTWESTACSPTNSGFCSAPDQAGGTGQNGSCSAKPCLSVKSSVFQNNEANLRVQIPSNYACVPDCWWQVRYVPGSGAVRDATEWSVAVTGDPVRLTD